MSEAIQRESMEYDVVIVGGGPAGMSTAIKLKQLSDAAGKELTICLLEKSAEVGAHILSGAVIEPRALIELFPDWQERGAPLNTPVKRDEMHMFNETGSMKFPGLMIPPAMHNKGNYIVSLSNVVRWLGEQAEALGIEIYPGFAGAEILYNEDGSVKGVATPNNGVKPDGSQKPSFEPGMELHAKYTVFAEGCRGQLGKELLEKFNLNENVDSQHYGIGFKELWEVDPANHEEGLVLHGSGWPLTDGLSGGCFMYHLKDNMVTLGLILDLNYSNPHVSPFDEFQRMKHHPEFAKVLEGGKRLGYGARALSKGGWNSLGKMSFPGGLLVGCDAGTLNSAKIKGTHTAMKSGTVAAEVLFEHLSNEGAGGATLEQFDTTFRSSWAGKELKKTRSFSPALHKFGAWLGGTYGFLEQILGGFLPAIHDNTADHLQLKKASECETIDYPKPDGKLSFDKPSSVFLSNTYHEEDIFCHLTLKDQTIPIDVNLAEYDAPEQRYCPAGVYEIVGQDEGKPALQINGQNCIHCKTCDIKDPTQNIVWIAPEGGGGPSYTNMQTGQLITTRGRSCGLQEKARNACPGFLRLSASQKRRLTFNAVLIQAANYYRVSYCVFMLQKLFSIITVLVLLSACATTPGASKKSNAIAQLDSKIDILADSLTATFNSVCAINLDQIEDELNSRLAKDLKEQLAKEKRLLASTKRNLAELDERCGEFSNDDKIIFGEVEDVTFIEEGLTLESRIDTGAETSSIGVYALTQFERDGKDWVRFKLVNLKKAPWLEYRIRDDVKIKSRVEGFSDERFEIRMDIKVGKTVYRRQVFNLANRKRFEYQALLGRSFLRDVALVDVGVKHQLKRNKNNKK